MKNNKYLNLYLTYMKYTDKESAIALANNALNRDKK